MSDFLEEYSTDYEIDNRNLYQTTLRFNMEKLEGGALDVNPAELLINALENAIEDSAKLQHALELVTKALQIAEEELSHENVT